MKKVLIASAALFFAAITNVNAQTEQPPVNKKEVVTTPQKVDQQTKAPVKPEALPETVKATLAGADYTGWNVASAFVVKGATDSYEVMLTKEKETKTVKFDKDGKPQM